MLFPTTLHRSEPELAANYRRFVGSVASAPAWDFSLLLPRGWAASSVKPELPGPARPVTSLAIFGTEGSMPACEAEVYASEIFREITAADWLEGFFAARGIEVLERRRVRTPQAGDRLDALTRRSSPTGPILSRWFTLKDGGDDRGRLLIIEVRTHESFYPKLAEDMLVVVGSFEMLHPSGWPFAERLRTFTSARPGDFLVYYPESWTAQEVTGPDDDECVAELSHTVADAPVGQITLICTLHAENPQTLVDRFARSLRRRGLDLQMPSVAEVPALGGLEQAWEGRGNAVEDAASGGPPPFDVQVALGRQGRIWYLFALLGVTRAKLHSVAALNERAFEIVQRFLRTAPVDAPPAPGV